VFFTSAMTPEIAAGRYLRSLKQAAGDIERRWRAHKGPTQLLARPLPRGHGAPASIKSRL
jgi:hypothetical protein